MKKYIGLFRRGGIYTGSKTEETLKGHRLVGRSSLLDLSLTFPFLN